MSNPYAKNEEYLPPDMNENNSPYQNIPVEQDIRQSFAAEANPLIGKEKSYHCRSLFSTLILAGGITFAVVSYVQDPVGMSQGALIGICVGTYLIYLMVALCCNELYQYLSNIDHGGHFQQEYGRVRQLIGHFVMTACCWHFQTRHHTRHYTDANGNRRTEHYTTQEKVITHNASQNHVPKETKDDSGNVDRINAQTNIVFIQFKVNYRFSDQASRSQFEYEYEHFKRRHNRDAYQEYTVSYIVPGLVPKKAFYVGELNCNMKSWFILFGLLGFIWPYSLWVEARISRFDVQFIKTLKM